jgi:hypothetical protein
LIYVPNVQSLLLVGEHILLLIQLFSFLSLLLVILSFEAVDLIVINLNAYSHEQETLE